MYASVENGRFTGVVYSEADHGVIDWHRANGLLVVPVPSLPENTGTEDNPDYGHPTLEQLQQGKLLEINRAFKRSAIALTADYPEEERLTWPTQQAEALAWEADNSTPTPYLDGIAAARNIDPEEMRELTLAQVKAFKQGSQQLVGLRQKLRDKVWAAGTAEEVAAINWPTI